MHGNAEWHTAIDTSSSHRTFQNVIVRKQTIYFVVTREAEKDKGNERIKNVCRGVQSIDLI